LFVFFIKQHDIFRLYLRILHFDAYSRKNIKSICFIKTQKRLIEVSHTVINSFWKYFIFYTCLCFCYFSFDWKRQSNIVSFRQKIDSYYSSTEMLSQSLFGLIFLRKYEIDIIVCIFRLLYCKLLPLLLRTYLERIVV